MKTRLEKVVMIDKILCELKKDELVSEIYSLKDNLTEKDDDVLLRKDFKSLVSDIPSKEETLKILKDPDDVDIIFKKAGIIAFLYGLTSLDGINDFASNLNKESFKDEGLKVEKLTQEEAEKKGIQYSVALLACFQEKVAEIMRLPINESSNKEETYSVNDLDEIDYEFIKLDNGDKSVVIKLLEEERSINLKRQFTSLYNSIITYSSIEAVKSRISKWKSLQKEEEAINTFIDGIKPLKDRYQETKGKDKKIVRNELSDLPKKFGEIYGAFKESVVKKYIGTDEFDNESENKTINHFLLMFSKVWKDKKYTEAIYNARITDLALGIKQDSGIYVRGEEGGFHEYLKFSKYINYLTKEKWGVDGPILTFLLTEVVQKTEEVEIFILDDNNKQCKFSHLDMYGKSNREDVVKKRNDYNAESTELKNFYNMDIKYDPEKKHFPKTIKRYETLKKDVEKKYSEEEIKKYRIWREGRKMMNRFHRELDNAINRSESAGEVLFNVKEVVYNTKDIAMTDDCKRKFMDIFKNVFSPEKEEGKKV